MRMKIIPIIMLTCFSYTIYGMHTPPNKNKHKKVEITQHPTDLFKVVDVTHQPIRLKSISPSDLAQSDPSKLCNLYALSLAKRGSVGDERPSKTFKNVSDKPRSQSVPNNMSTSARSIFDPNAPGFFGSLLDTDDENDSDESDNELLLPYDFSR
jgi:hypothetical protein